MRNYLNTLINTLLTIHHVTPETKRVSTIYSAFLGQCFTCLSTRIRSRRGTTSFAPDCHEYVTHHSDSYQRGRRWEIESSSGKVESKHRFTWQSRGRTTNSSCFSLPIGASSSPINQLVHSRFNHLPRHGIKLTGDGINLHPVPESGLIHLRENHSGNRKTTKFNSTIP